MDDLVIGGKQYVSSKRAAQMTGYAKDYIGQMCRSGKLDSKLVGRTWYVEPRSLLHISSKKASSFKESSTPESEISSKTSRANAVLEESSFAYEPEKVSFEEDDRPLVPEPIRLEDAGVGEVTENIENQAADSVEEETRTPKALETLEVENNIKVQEMPRKAVRASRNAVDLRAIRNSLMPERQQVVEPEPTPEHQTRATEEVSETVEVPTRRTAHRVVRKPALRAKKVRKYSPSTIVGTAVLTASIALIVGAVYSRVTSYPNSATTYAFDYQALVAGAGNSSK